VSSWLTALRDAGMSELACQFAQFIARKEANNEALVPVTSALLVDALTQGHVCLNLQQATTITPQLASFLPSTDEQWRQQLKHSKTVGNVGDYKPLLLNEQGQLYLYKLWQDEQSVAKAIKRRLQAVADIDCSALQQELAAWDNPVDGIDWQKVAVTVALTRQLAVISGGPGTGKTTIVMKILQCLRQQYQDITIALAAPTGKAATRLQHAIGEQQQVEVKTLHRLLGITETNERGRYNAERTLAVDVLIVDEASMIDISLMAKLLNALPATARLILLGDSQQLASVESGAVLANLSQQQQGQFSADFIERHALLGLASTEQNVVKHPLMDSFVRLQHSYRFDADSLIGQLAKAVNLGEPRQAMDVLAKSASLLQAPTAANIQQTIVNGYTHYIEAVEQENDAISCLTAFEQFRVLTATRQGPHSVASVNQLMMRYLMQRGWQSQKAFYRGRPIMITQNDYRQGLFNGDTGIILPDEMGVFKACFLQNHTPRWVALNRLPAHETVFAMTIHKSQGSEFDTVCVLLPVEESTLLNRELLYTAITRARKQLSILATEHILQQSIITQHHRETGLAVELRKTV